MPAFFSPDTTAALRRLLVGIVAFMTAGTALDLALLSHTKDALQVIPFALLAAVVVALVVLWRRPRAGVRALQVVMGAVIAGGGLGVVLHLQAGVAFHRELDEDASTVALTWSALRAQAPPVLAPAALLQLGLVGLAFTFRHPALSQHKEDPP